MGMRSCLNPSSAHVPMWKLSKHQLSNRFNFFTFYCSVFSSILLMNLSTLLLHVKRCAYPWYVDLLLSLCNYVLTWNFEANMQHLVVWQAKFRGWTTSSIESNGGTKSSIFKSYWWDERTNQKRAWKGRKIWDDRCKYHVITRDRSST